MEVVPPPPKPSRRHKPKKDAAPKQAESDGAAPAKPKRRGRGARGGSQGGADHPPHSARAAGSQSATPETSGRKKRIYFKDYIEGVALEQALATGALFKTAIRCNPHDRVQAFCTVPGLPNDIFIRGWKPQNRAIQDDVVAIRILPTSKWYKLSGPSGKLAPEDEPGEPLVDDEESPPTPSTIGNITPFSRPSEDREMTPPVWATVAAGPVDLPSDGLVASPALVPSASGGELAVSLEQDPWEVLEEGEEEGAKEGEGEGTEVDDFNGTGSLTSFMAEKLKDGLVISSALEAAPPAAVLPWEAADSPSAATKILSDLLLGKWAGWRATAEVVAVMEPSPRRASVVGVLRAANRTQVKLEPCDPRLPRAHANMRSIPPELRRQLQEEALQEDVPSRTLVCWAITSWGQGDLFPNVAFKSIVGRAGGLEAEIAALLITEGVEDDDQFTPEVLACLPPTPWTIGEDDVASRRDLRSWRIFSIDPPTARDLDDALSVEDLGNGRLRIGVHIADVSHFVRPDTPLDSEAAARSTSVYLVDRVIPMLPRLLCEELCSLNPGVDRLAMSIIWDMTPEGDILDTWIGRTIISSCAKLSYPMVQAMIDGDGTIPAADAPPPEGIALHGAHAWADVVRDSLTLHSVASSLRQRRFDAGALRLDNARLFFHCDADGQPTEFGIYEQKEANRLVEEFMLAANMTAARTISSAFPSCALLRRHPPPSPEKMLELATSMQRLLPDAPPLDGSSSGALHASLTALREALGVGTPQADVVTLLCTKPMQLARYFCTGDAPDEANWRHYALAVDHYTHFTSPIRRYPDVIVHRLLMAVVAQQGSDVTGGSVAPLPETDRVSVVSAHANERKYAAKAAQDGSLQLYLAVLLLREPRVEDGVIVALGGSRYFDVYVPTLGCDVRVQTASLLRGGEAALHAEWCAPERTLTLGHKVRRNRKEEDTAAAAAAGELNLDDIENAAAVVNVKDLPRMALPLSLRTLGKVTLLVGARKSKASGSPAGIHAKLWIE